MTTKTQNDKTIQTEKSKKQNEMDTPKMNEPMKQKNQLDESNKRSTNNHI